MTTTDYQHSFTVPASMETVYAALTAGIPAWWTEDFSGKATQPGEVFTVRFGGTFMTFRIDAALPGHKLTWTCTDNLQDMPGLSHRTEWIGTRMHWQLTPEGNSTRLEMVHEGLNPEMECWDICQQGWNFFLGSLRKVLEGEKGDTWKV